MILPYVGNTDFYDLGVGENDWILYYIPIHPVTSVFGVTPPNITVTIYASYTDVTVQQLVPQMKKDKEPGMLSGGLNYAARILNNSKIPYKSVWAAVAHLGSTLAETLGYGRQPDAISTTMLSRRIGDMSIMSGGSDQCYQLMANPGVCKSVEFAGLPRRHANETNISYLKGIPSLLVTAASNDVPYNISPGVAPNLSGVYSFSPLNMCCYMFDYWRGDMWVELRFTCSPMIRARYLVTVIGADVTAPTTNFDNGSNIAKIVEVCGSTRIKFKVGYLNILPMTQSNVTTTTGAVTCPQIIINLIGAVAGPTASPPSPFIDVWVWADENMSFTCPSLRAIQNMWQVQSGKVGPGFTGESIEDVKELCKRSAFMVQGYDYSGNPDPLAMPTDGIVPYYDGTTLPMYLNNMTFNSIMWTFPTFIRTLFLGSVGGMCHRVNVSYQIGGVETYRRVNCTQAVEIPGDYATYNRNNTKHVFAFSGASGWQVCSETGLVECATQDKSQYLFHSPQRLTYNIASTPCYCFIVMKPTNQESFTVDFDWFLAARDDFDVGMIVCNPAFQFR